MHVDILSKLQNVFQTLFEDDKLVITENTTNSDIEEWDSLMNLQLINMIEQEFNIQFSLVEISNFSNVGDIVRSIENHSN